VNYYRQQKNVGSLRNFETCINRAKGHLVHLLHGDDRVKDGFYRSFTNVFQEFPEVGAVFCGYSIIDEGGEKIRDVDILQENLGLFEGAYLKMAEGVPIQFATTVVKREAYEKLGSFFGVIAGEDWEMWTRVAKNYPIAYIPQILAEYRRYKGTISWPKIENGVYAKSLAKTLFLIESQLPKKDRHVMRKTRGKRAKSTITTALYVWRRFKNIKLVNDLSKLAVNLDSSSFKVYYSLIYLYLKILKDSLLSPTKQKQIFDLTLSFGKKLDCKKMVFSGDYYNYPQEIFDGSIRNSPIEIFFKLPSMFCNVLSL
jgi:hypothetical protein